MKTILLSLIFLATLPKLLSQDVQFTGSAKNIVSTGEQFRLIYTVNAKGSNFKAPSMENFTVLMGPSTSSSSSMQIINGQVSQSFSYSYTYILQANTEGKHTLKPAEIIVNGQTYKSNEIEIEVVKGSSAGQQQQNQANTQQISNEDIFVRVILNKNNVYQGEQIVATVAIYTRLSLVGFEEMKFPSYKGFWSDDIENPAQIQLKNEKYNGTVYQVGVLKKTLIAPQHSGDLVVEPFDITCVVQQRVQRTRQSFFDDFFGSYQNVRKKLTSAPVTVHVKPLPSNKPPGFSGAVGNFSLHANLDRNNVKMNEAIALTLKLSGTGNHKLAEMPKIDFPPDFEQFDPKITNNINATSSGTSGTKIINYLLIPRHAGEYKIPQASFSFFDLNSQSYKTLYTPEFIIHVDKDSVSSSQAVISEFSKEDVKFLGSDIHYIKSHPGTIKHTGRFLIATPLFYLSYPLSFGLFVFIIFWRRKQIKRNADVIAMKNRKASRVAGKRLRSSQKFLKENNKEAFYEELSRALWGYLSDKLMIPVSELSKEKAISELSGKGVSDEVITDINSIIDSCETARYAPSAENDQLTGLFSNAKEIIGKLENNIK